jgi:hypothetical protein
VAKVKEEEAHICGAWDETYESQLDKGDGICDVTVREGDVHVNACGEITHVKDTRRMDEVIQEHEVVGERQKALVARISKLHELTTDRFHIMGGTSEGKPFIFLSTEFAFDLTRKYFWRRVRSFAYRNGGVINQMTRSLEDGGVIEKHVEVVWRIEDMTYDEVKALIERARKTSGDIWEEGGMSVR